MGRYAGGIGMAFGRGMGMGIEELRRAAASLWPRLVDHAPLSLILLVAAVLRTWQLSSNGFGRQYYAAGVRSMMSCPRCFLFNSFDPGGFVSLDKPPIAIWLQVLSAKLVGFNGIAMLLPQVAEGIVAILLVYLLVTRSFGKLAGLFAAALLAVTPVAVAVDRSNNMESCLIVMLLASAWAGVRAAESGNAKPLILSMALLGLGFNVKMAAALALAPVVLAVYACAGGRSALPRRLATSFIACLALLVVSLSWVTLYDLTPTSDRPYVGSTTGNSMFELALRHNGMNRFIARLRPNALPPSAGPDGSPVAAPPQGVRAQRARFFDDSPIGLSRLFRPLEAAQSAWWLPIALAAILLGWNSDGRADDEAARRIASRRITIALCGGWVAIYWLAFSFAGGVVHYYYLAVLGPPLAALAGIGMSELYLGRGSKLAEAGPALLIVTTLWQSYLVLGQAGADSRSWVTWLWVASAAAALLPSALLARPGAMIGQKYRQRNLLVLFCCGASFAMPAACALSVVLVRPNVSAPIANLTAFHQPPNEGQRRGLGNGAAADRLLAFLQGQRGSERFLAAVPSSMVAAPLIIATGMPVIAMGGFAGADPILTPPQLERLVASRQVRFVMIGGARRAVNQQTINDWVRAHGKPVEPALWRLDQPAADSSSQAARGQRGMPAELFDLRG